MKQTTNYIFCILLLIYPLTGNSRSYDIKIADNCLPNTAITDTIKRINLLVCPYYPA